jgi:FkbM family methyltransferase
VWRAVADVPGLIATRSLLAAAAVAGTKRARARTFWGAEMLVLFPEPVSVQLYRFGYYEEGLTRAFLDLVGPGMVVFDVGAHFGYFSLLAKTLVGSQGSVHSFEPSPSTFRVLSENTRKWPSIAIHRIAMYSSETRIKFFDYGIEHSAYNSAFQPRLPEALRRALPRVAIDVATTTIDGFVARSSVVPSFVKIDAESAELHILQGMDRTLRRHRPTVSLEVGDFLTDVAEVARSRELVEYLVARDYDAYETTLEGLVPHVLRDRYEYENLVFIPAERRAEGRQ